MIFWLWFLSLLDVLTACLLENASFLLAIWKKNHKTLRL